MIFFYLLIFPLLGTLELAVAFFFLACTWLKFGDGPIFSRKETFWDNLLNIFTFVGYNVLPTLLMSGANLYLCWDLAFGILVAVGIFPWAPFLLVICEPLPSAVMRRYAAMREDLSHRKNIEATVAEIRSREGVTIHSEVLRDLAAIGAFSPEQSTDRIPINIHFGYAGLSSAFPGLRVKHQELAKKAIEAHFSVSLPDDFFEMDMGEACTWLADHREKTGGAPETIDVIRDVAGLGRVESRRGSTIMSVSSGTINRIFHLYLEYKHYELSLLPGVGDGPEKDRLEKDMKFLREAIDSLATPVAPLSLWPLTVTDTLGGETVLGNMEALVSYIEEKTGCPRDVFLTVRLVN